VLRAAGDEPGLLAFSRLLPREEVLVLVNTSTQPVRGNVQVDVGSTRFRSLMGRCTGTARAPGSVSVTLPPLGYAVCHAAR
jgi:hypothetical protein